jgi:hypothetical protein
MMKTDLHPGLAQFRAVSKQREIEPAIGQGDVALRRTGEFIKPKMAPVKARQGVRLRAEQREITDAWNIGPPELCRRIVGSSLYAGDRSTNAPR